jgi:hypothetical protein
MIDWENIFKGSCFVILFAIVISLFLYFFSSKHFKGYYLNQLGGTHSIYINWENAPDEKAFETYNAKEALDVLKQLKYMDKE